MANIDSAFNVGDIISFEDNILVTSGSIDPTVGLGFEAPIGSLFLRTDGSIYSKNAAPDTGWTINGVTGSVAWGDIVGILSNQTDLQTELDARVLVAGDTMTGNLSIFPTSGDASLTLRSPTATSLAEVILQDNAGVVVANFQYDQPNDIVNLSTTKDLVLNDYITIADGGTAYTLPTGDGTVNQVISTDGAGNLSFSTVITTDELVSRSAADTTPGTLDAKIFAGSGINFTVNNPGANESITISNSFAATSDLAAVCVSRTTTFALATSFANITWNITDVENDPAVLEHNNVNTDRIEIKDSGTYLVTYSLSIDADPGEEVFDFKVVLNDTTDVPCSLRTISEDHEINAVTSAFPAIFTAGDYITLQAMASAGGQIFSLGHNFTITRLRGSKGDAGADGAPGSGSTLIVREEGVNLANTPHSSLNFIGGSVAAVDAGAGQANITVTGGVFGSEFQRAESLGVTTTTSTAFLNKVTLGTTSLPAGTYRIAVYYGWNHDSTGNDFEARVREDAVQLGQIHKQEPQDSSGGFSTTGSSQRFTASKVFYRTLTAGVRTYTLDFRTDVGGAGSSMWDAVIEVWRVT